MSLEKAIIEWSRDRPAWQREVMRRAAIGKILSNDDYDQITENILTPDMNQEVSFKIGDFPQSTATNPPVRLLSITQLRHVNALTPNQNLDFHDAGITIVYGDNGSGKSGYARLLKQVARSRHQEEILTDVFKNTPSTKPAANLEVKIGDQTRLFTWPSVIPDLQRMLFYDRACGVAYIDAESSFPYRPSALGVMDALIKACGEVDQRIETRLQRNNFSKQATPNVPIELQNTNAGKFLRDLSDSSTIATLDSLIEQFDQSKTTIADLKAQETSLRATDTSKERAALKRQAEKLEALSTHISEIDLVLGDRNIQVLQSGYDSLVELNKAKDIATRSFQNEPLQGVGTSAWKELWDSAKRFSEQHAYQGNSFPVLNENSRCVLCQQTLEKEGRERLSRFQEFVMADTQKKFDQEHARYNEKIKEFKTLNIFSDNITEICRDLNTTHAELMKETQAVLNKYKDALDQTVNALSNPKTLSLFQIDAKTMCVQLNEAATAAQQKKETLSNPELVQKRLVAITQKLKEFEFLEEIKKSREPIVKEIHRLKQHKKLVSAKQQVATMAITKKIMDLSEESITTALGNAFDQEKKRMKLERVAIARSGARKGELNHKPVLINAQQDATLPRVLSEGEQTALGLVALFAEAELDHSKSAIILDDPVSSLDHIRRGLVAERIAEFAKKRQVIVFTHDVAFVAELNREAKGRQVPVTERSIFCMQNPGICATCHPWKAKDVATRLDSLTKELNKIKYNQNQWDPDMYKDEVGKWAGKLSETWERIFSQEIVGQILANGGLEVRPNMVKILACFSKEDEAQFNASYSRASKWALRHDKSDADNYVPPAGDELEKELEIVRTWFNRVKKYKHES